MTVRPEADRWIQMEEAFSSLEARVGLPQGLLPRPTSGLSLQEGGMMWFKDHAILVHETPSGFGFERSEFDAIMKNIEPIKLGDA